METIDKKIEKIQALSQLVSRNNLLGKFMNHYKGDRKLLQILGYPVELSYDDYWQVYKRQDMANAIIKRPIKVTWRGDLKLLESKGAEDTPLEKAFTTLSEDLKLKTVFSRLDRVTGLGRYGVLLLGLSDVSTREQFANEVTSKNLKLLYLKPLGEKAAEIKEFDNNPQSKRYGKPRIYKIDLSDEITKTTNELLVHHSRIIHVTEDSDEDENYGTPRLEAVFNRLLDLQKLVGGSAEMFWRGARPGYGGFVKEGFQFTETEQENLEQKLDEFEHDLRRFLISEGIEYKTLEPQVSDPKSHVDIQVQMISAATGIPKRILTGTERGELASSQDTEHWYSMIQERRDEFAEPNIVRPFVDRMIELNILPETKAGERYDILWTDLFSVSEKDKAEIGNTRAEALAKYVNAPGAEGVVSPKAFISLFLGFTDEEQELIETHAGDYMEDLFKDFPHEEGIDKRSLEDTAQNTKAEDGDDDK